MQKTDDWRKRSTRRRSARSLLPSARVILQKDFCGYMVFTEHCVYTLVVLPSHYHCKTLVIGNALRQAVRWGNTHTAVVLALRWMCCLTIYLFHGEAVFVRLTWSPQDGRKEGKVMNSPLQVLERVSFFIGWIGEKRVTACKSYGYLENIFTQYVGWLGDRKKRAQEKASCVGMT